MKRLIFSLLLILVCIRPAAADNNLTLEILLGMSDQNGTIKGSSSTSGDDFSFALRSSYKLNTFISIDAAYTSFGEIDDTHENAAGHLINEKLTSSAISAGISGTAAINANTSIHGRVGLSQWNFELTRTHSNLPSLAQKLVDRGSNYYYGLGLKYTVSESVFIGTEYSVIDMDITALGISLDNEVKFLSFIVGYKN